MWKNIAKELANELKALSTKFITAIQQNDIQAASVISAEAQTKLTEMFRQLRNSQDHNEISKDAGKNSDLGYSQNINSDLDEFKKFKNQRSLFQMNQNLTLRDCANAVFHHRNVDYFIDANNVHWLMFVTDRGKLVIMDLQKVCDVIIATP